MSNIHGMRENHMLVNMHERRFADVSLA